MFARRFISAVVGLLALFACDGNTGPSLDGEQFLAVTVNDSTWQLVDLGLSQTRDQVNFGGFHHSLPDRLYAVGLYASPFTGPANYPLSSSPDQLYIDLRLPGWFTQSYGIDPAHPGLLTITDFRTSDSTYVGTFSGDLVHIVVDSAPVPALLSVHGSFRLRPGNTAMPAIPPRR